MSRTLCVCLLVLISVPVTAQEHPALRWGTPDTGHILFHDTFVLSYDRRLRSARWTAERLTNESLVVGTGVDRQDLFREDPRIPVELRAALDDYSGSGRDRGHLANSANHRLTQAMNDDTFYLSNMSPQVGNSFNRHYWARLEASVRNLAERPDIARVYLFTGPLFMPDDAPDQGTAPSNNGSDEFSVTYRFVGPNHVPEPTHYFKAVFAVRDDRLGPPEDTPRYQMWAFILPNEAIASNTPIGDFGVTTDFLEHWAGFDLWDKLADDAEADLESHTETPWEPLPPSS